jgi:hypothetical protein
MEITLEVGKVYLLEELMYEKRLVVYAGDESTGIKQKNSLWICDARTYGTTNQFLESIRIGNIQSMECVGRMRKWYEFWQPRVVLFANQ